MARRRKYVPEGGKVPLALKLTQRDLIVEHTMVGPELTDALTIAEIKNGRIIVHYTLDDLEELAGYVAAEANHAKDKKLQKHLDVVFALVTKVQDSYYDDLSPDHVRGE
jgi:hypothetical protein